MQVDKRLKHVSFRPSDEEREQMREYCARKGVTRSELIRRAVRSLLATPTDDKPGVEVKPRSAKVSRVDDHGTDRLYAENGALKR